MQWDSLHALTTFWSGTVIVVVLLGFICCFIGKIRNNYFAWTLRCGCLAGLVLEITKFINLFYGEKGAGCVAMAIIVNGSALWRYALVVIYMIQIASVLTKVSKPQPISIEGSTSNVGLRYMSAMVLVPICCYSVFAIADVVARAANYPLFQYREKLDKCDFDENVNFVVVIAPGMIMLLINMVVFGMCIQGALTKVDEEICMRLTPE